MDIKLEDYDYLVKRDNSGKTIIDLTDWNTKTTLHRFYTAGNVVAGINLHGTGLADLGRKFIYATVK